MKYILGTILLFLVLNFAGKAQQNDNALKKLNAKFESFKYSDVILYADSLLNSDFNFNDQQLLEIYRMKGISEYSLLEDASARNSFLAILNINKEYELDSAKTSPKIISFFNEVKNKFLSDLKEKEKMEVKSDTSRVPEKLVYINSSDEMRKTLLRSLIIPGFGQLYKGEKLKGIILTSVGAASLASMIYFIIDSNKKEKDYLNSTDPSIIPAKYDSYNKSYKMKNISLISFAVVWLYSQIDILFFTDFDSHSGDVSSKLPHLNYDKIRGIQLGYNFSF